MDPLDADAAAMREAIHDHLAAGNLTQWRETSLLYADWLEEQGNLEAATRRRRKVKTLRPAGLLWPHAGEVPGLSTHQTEQLRIATSRPFGILAGTPGTGKTYTTARLLQAIRDSYKVGMSEIGIVAPTGKAAVRITEVMRGFNLPFQATTIHQALEIGRNGHDGQGWAFRRNADNPLHYRVLIVEESSMLDTVLFASLLTAVRPGTHVLLIGDPYQLPPVGAGAPLRDLINSGAVPVGTLTEIKRNAGWIVEACSMIRQGRPFRATTTPSFTGEQNLGIIEVAHPEGQIEELECLLNSDFWRLEQSNWQILCVTNEGPLGRKELNKKIQSIVNENDPVSSKHPYRLKDKIICLRNGFYRPVRDPQNRPDVWLANGQQGIVTAATEDRVVAVFDGAVTVEIPIRSVPAGSAEPSSDCFDLAWAITAHKAQGSEWPAVAVIVDASNGAARVAGREWIYTAISRARNTCWLIGRLEVAIHMGKRPMLTKRKTLLAERLRGEIRSETGKVKGPSSG